MRNRARVAILASPLLWLLPAASARAQSLDVTGSWSIQMLATPKGTAAVVASSCGFQGTANVSQTGSQFTGDITVNQTSGAMTCPSSMSANLNGTVTGNQVNMGVVMGGGAFGTATFAGALSGGAPRAAARAAATTMSGTFTVTGGPFSGTGGTWSATQLAPLAAVPALDAKGLAALALLLVLTALWFLVRRSALRGR
jgi:hypothetical protein